MALYRTISIGFWTDSKVTDEFTPEDKLFYLYLFTNPHTNLAGCYEISHKQMAFEIGYSVESIRTLIERFENTYNVIRYSEKTKEILLINWHKYNWTTSEKFRKPLEKEISKVKQPEFKEYLSRLFEGEETYGIDTVSEKTEYPIDTSNTNTNTNTNTNNKDNSPIRDYKDVDKVIEEYNRICTSLPKCMRATKKRREKIATRLNDYTLDDFIKAFEMSEESDFLSGRRTEWRASLDWFIQNEDNLAKVLEGRYVETKTGNAEAEGHSSGDSEFYEDLPDVW